MLYKSLAHFHLLVESSQTNVAIEDHTVEIIGLEGLVDQDALPVLSPTAVLFEHLYLFISQ